MDPKAFQVANTQLLLAAFLGRVIEEAALIIGRVRNDKEGINASGDRALARYNFIYFIFYIFRKNGGTSSRLSGEFKLLLT